MVDRIPGTEARRRSREVRRGAGLWELKKQATREALQQATLRLVTERGMENVTIEDISRAAQVSPRTFANYFGAKEDALAGDGPRPFDPDDLVELVGDPAADAIPRRVCQLLARSVEPATGRWDEMQQRRILLERYPDLMARMLGRFARLERDLAAALAERLGVDPRQDVRPQLYAATAITALRVAFLRWTEQDHQRSFHDHLEEAFGHLRLDW